MRTNKTSKVLFLTLRIFSATGGIEKVCRVAGKALVELGLQYGGILRIYCMYGHKHAADSNTYFPQTVFTGFGGNKLRYVIQSMWVSRRVNLVLMSHVNLLIVGVLVKLLNPRARLVLICHGIEVWRPFPAWKRAMLRRVDLFLPVSHFTQAKMQQLYQLPRDRFSVMNNCLSPALERPIAPGKSPELLQRYGLLPQHKVLLTVSRLANTEQYKGYDHVLEALPGLLKQDASVRYLLVGKYDATEKKRLDRIITRLGLDSYVVFAGFVPDEEMPAHFTLGDVFVLPSEKEGFGIVFIEAMFYGLPVIAGNTDGSVDALCNGELGVLVNPQDTGEIAAAIKTVLANPQQYKPNAEKLHYQFGYTWYKRKLHKCLERVVGGGGEGGFPKESGQGG